MNRTAGKMTWTESLISRFSTGESRHLSHEESLEESRSNRIRLTALVRWLLLAVMSLYGFFAGVFYLFSRYESFIVPEQIAILIVLMAVVFFYNLASHFRSAALASYGYSCHLLILFDLFAITVLIHYSGGAISWFWSVYMIVTLEAAYLLERQRDVWLVVVAGWFAYCLLLLVEYLDLLPPVKMPFVDSSLSHDEHYILLMTTWVIVTNAVTALIANFLMAVIRRESRETRDNEERLLNFIDNANDLIHCITPDGKILFMNQTMRRALGYLPDENIEGEVLGLINGNSQELALRKLKKIISGKNVEAFELCFRGAEDREIWAEGNLTCNFRDGVPVLLWGIWRDVTEKKRTQENLFTLAHNDTLTGLPNRILFRDRLKQAIAYATRSRRSVGLLFLDLDRFKVINDSLGHPVGDRLLQHVAQTLRSKLREVDTVARFGGDEFTIVLGNLEHTGDAGIVSGKIIEAMQQPFTIDGHELFAMGSIGISLFPEHGEDIDTLIKKADIAMYEAKSQGGSRFVVYEQGMDANSHKRLLLENSLRKALANDEFRLVYQPKVDIVSGQITAMEALLRWEHPELGPVTPDVFIPIAEEMGLIMSIGEWVLDHACRQNLEWQKQGIPQMRIAVNISGYQLQQVDFIKRLEQIVAGTGMPFDLLEVEITESVIMQNSEYAIKVLNEIQNKGIHISVDDFGTGYSSLAHLKRFSVNTLKIDKSFVRDIEFNQTDAAITSAIIAMGNSLKLKVIAEGVETEGQYTFLQEAMCDEIQGYLISRPIPPEKVFEFITSREEAKIPTA